ncbi:MAG: hypothetical protein A3G38_03830 [Omnitrophica WOR_2 bacterium RIFCSPLOWO2_12_FULL_51_8]|nr:MAG: hypothetical protein A3G38_03830 [Omnitrophica WOR_2 bacterium RIFCSPLOWO2_12_FULL_51_8]
MRALLLVSLMVMLGPPNQAIGARDGQSRRYISLAPATTEILFALGLGEEIVGVSSYCDYPPEAKTKQAIGSFSSPNAEKIIALRPDYIFATGLEQAMAVNQLRQLNLKVYVSDPANMAELLASIREIGRLTARQIQAETLITKMRAVLKKIETKIKLIPVERRPRVFVEFWHDPLTTAGGRSFISELVTLAGGVNIAADIDKPYVHFSPEEVVRRNPGCIILVYMQGAAQKENLGRRLGWNKITALKNNRVYNDIDPNILLRPGPRLTDGLDELYQRLYSEKCITTGK